MDATTVINLSYAGAAFAAGIGLLWLSCPRRPSEAERTTAARVRVGFTVWDFDAEEWVELPPGVEPGPAQMTARDIAKADELELLYLSRAYDRASAAIDEGLTRLFEQLGPPPACDPAWDAGMERLWDAVRDQQNQTKGENS